MSPTTVSAAWQLLREVGNDPLGRSSRHDGRPPTRAVASATPGRCATSPPCTSTSRGIPDGALLPPLVPVLSVWSNRRPRAAISKDHRARRTAGLSWPRTGRMPPRWLLVVEAPWTRGPGLPDLLRPGDLVLVENTGFPPLLDLLEDRGVDVLGVPLDETGLDLDCVEKLLPRRPAAVVLQPRGQNRPGVDVAHARAPPGRRVARAGLHRRRGRLERNHLDVHSHQSRSLDTGPGAHHPQLQQVPRSRPAHRGDQRAGGAARAPVRHARAIGQGWTSRLLQRVLAGSCVTTSAPDVPGARAEYADGVSSSSSASRRTASTCGHRAPGSTSGSPSGRGGRGAPPGQPGDRRDARVAVRRRAPCGPCGHRGTAAPGAPAGHGTGHVRVTHGLIRENHAGGASLIASRGRGGVDRAAPLRPAPGCPGRLGAGPAPRAGGSRSPARPFSGYSPTAGSPPNSRVAPVSKPGHPGSPSIANEVQASRTCLDSSSASGLGSPISRAGCPTARLPNTRGTSRPWQAPSTPPMPGAGQVSS